MFSWVRNVSQEYPRTFWILTGATFIDQVGGWLLFPFFALYVTDHFGVGMTEVGILFAIFSVANFIGMTIGYYLFLEAATGRTLGVSNQAFSWTEAGGLVPLPSLASRPFGAANGANPLPLVVPCHRVISSDGKLGGYGGGAEAKRRLLALEKAAVGANLL